MVMSALSPGLLQLRHGINCGQFRQYIAILNNVLSDILSGSLDNQVQVMHVTSRHPWEEGQDECWTHNDFIDPNPSELWVW